MAHTAHQSQTGFSVLGLIAKFGSAITNALVSLAEAQSRVRKVNYLQSLSDEELQKRGLTRERIVHRVFTDSLWL